MTNSAVLGRVIVVLLLVHVHPLLLGLLPHVGFILGRGSRHLTRRLHFHHGRQRLDRTVKEIAFDALFNVLDGRVVDVDVTSLHAHDTLDGEPVVETAHRVFDLHLLGHRRAVLGERVVGAVVLRQWIVFRPASGPDGVYVVVQNTLPDKVESECGVPFFQVFLPFRVSATIKEECALIP